MNHFHFHPRHQERIPSLAACLEGLGLSDHHCILSSGTTSEDLKGLALSTEALVANAKAVNSRLNLESTDRWGLSLPPYHIGGLSVMFRARLLGHEPIELYPWRPESFAGEIEAKKVTVVSLVPTQVWDLVQRKVKAPACLHHTLVGGDFLGEKLEQEFQLLGWPVVRTFGMTEVGSQLATGGTLEGGLEILPLHELRADATGRLWVRSPALFTVEFRMRRDWDVTWAKDRTDAEGLYPLSDAGEVIAGRVRHRGRIDGSFKSSGHLISLPELRNQLETYLIANNAWGKMEFYVKEDERKGNVLGLAYEKSAAKLIAGVDYLIRPLRIESYSAYEVLARTELGKYKAPC